jgi:hypothetical protein
MLLPDLGPLLSAGGLVVAVAVALGLASLFIRGDVVPRGTFEREVELRTAAEKRLSEQTPLLREQGEQLDKITERVGFLVDFVKSTALEQRDRDRRRDGP